MSREDSVASSQADPLSRTPAELSEVMRDASCVETGETRSAESTAPFFPVTERVTFKSLPAVPLREGRLLSPGVARLVSLVSLGAVMLWPLSSCGDAESSLPCPVPTPSAVGTSVPDGTPTASCTTSRGTHYVWVHNRGGWVQSNDGIHPNANASGIGADEDGNGHGSRSSGSGGEEGHGGVGEGHGGTGHGGGEGG